MTAKFEACGVMGVHSKPWRKTFATQEAFEKWLEKHEGDVEVYAFRDLEEQKGETK